MIRFEEFLVLKETDLVLADGTKLGVVMYQMEGDASGQVYVTAIVDLGNDLWTPGTPEHQRFVNEHAAEIFDGEPEATLVA